MGTTPQTIRELARQLIAAEPARVGSSPPGADQPTQAWERLRLPLTKLAGVAGFAALLSRALAVARRQAPSLAALRVEADGSLAGFNEIQQHVKGEEEARHGEAVLLAEMLGLLVTFIGAPMTLRLVRETWPGLSIEITSLSTEEKR